MRFASGRLTTVVLLGSLALLQGCGGGRGASAVPAGPTTTMQTPKSVSPASVYAPPMAQTAIQPPSTMSSRKPRSDIQQLGWTQLTGAAVFVTASPDGSIWVLSPEGPPGGRDKYIYHYVNGNWTNIPGWAVRLAVGPDNTLWAVNSVGGIYAYNGSWRTMAGGASDISIGPDNSIYVISNANGGPDGRGIWHFANGYWQQLPGAGVRIAASADTGTYPGGIAPGGFYVTNAYGSIYYYNPSSGYHLLTGAATEAQPTKNGGLFVLGAPPPNPNGNPIYYNNLATGVWKQQAGSGVSLATDGSTHVYAVGHEGGIYQSSLAANTPLPGTGTPLTGPATDPYGAWGPTAVANALNFPVQSRFDGAGTTVGIIIDSNVNGSDLGNYMAYFRTPATGRTLRYELIDGASLYPTASQNEATLDYETIAGLAPGANILLYVVPDLNGQRVNDAIQQVLNDHVASIVSMSFGGCEYPGVNSQSGQSGLFAQGSRQGIAFVAASGDQGNACYNGLDPYGNPLYQYGVSFPASDVNVTGVGGTESPPSYGLTSITAWNDFNTLRGNQEATGGGVSTNFGIPSYQQGLAGTASTTMRNVPDVAMPAEYASIFVNGGWKVQNGTSWSAPAYAALLSEVYNYCTATYRGAAGIPYYVYAAARYNAFFDVVNGGNQFGSYYPAFSARGGYDNATGIGVPLGMQFANTLCPNRVPASQMRALDDAAVAAARPATPVAAALAPKVPGLSDRGRRGSSELTRMQIVLRNSNTLASDEQAVITVLRGAGFTITKTFANHLVVDAEGPTSAAEKLFSTEIHNVVQPGYGTRYTPVTAGVIPASLAPYVAGLSLDNLVTMRAR